MNGNSHTAAKGKVELFPLGHEIRLSYKQKTTASERPRLASSADAETYLRSIWDEGTIGLYESFYCLYLSRNNKIKAWAKISQGGIAGTVADPKLIMCYGVKVLCSSIILAHNPPKRQ